MDVLEKMSYEGACPPPTIKKLLHPYWRFLAHIYLVCISGNKSGLDKLTLKQTSGVVSLVEGWKYNYSKSIFDDMLANVKIINEKYWYKLPRFLQLILEKKYPKLPVKVKTYDVKMMNHMVFSMLNRKSRDNVEIKYQNKKKLEKFGAFAEIQEEAPAQINAIIAEEHDVEIIEAPVGTKEPIENGDLTGIESEEDVADDRMVDDEEVNENVDEIEKETEIHAESLIVEPENIDEPVNMSPPHVEPVTTTDTADVDNTREDSTADLPPRKRSRRDPRINGEVNVEAQTTTDTTTPTDTTQPKFNYIPSELNTKTLNLSQTNELQCICLFLNPVKVRAMVLLMLMFLELLSYCKLLLGKLKPQLSQNKM
ncbi:hypothetical protein HanPI659440_Chr05g0188501 [Helianthus annuus]|nr:hypothetical protein HanPI659440_Chr05g0188501 [Helianthus annuus]